MKLRTEWRGRTLHAAATFCAAAPSFSVMNRIPTHTVDDAPQASRALLASVIQFSPTGRPLNLHGQMAHSPAVLVAYTSLRAATAQHGTVGPRLSAPLMLAGGGGGGHRPRNP